MKGINAIPHEVMAMLLSTLKEDHFCAEVYTTALDAAYAAIQTVEVQKHFQAYYMALIEVVESLMGRGPMMRERTLSFVVRSIHVAFNNPSARDFRGVLSLIKRWWNMHEPACVHHIAHVLILVNDVSEPSRSTRTETTWWVSTLIRAAMTYSMDAHSQHSCIRVYKPSKVLQVVSNKTL